MKTTSLAAYLMNGDQTIRKLGTIPIMSTTGIRIALGLHACHLFGKEGQDWRIVQDQTLIGFHASGKGAFTNEWIAVR